ncbi:MAG: beta-N-acetylhexosaminidase [Candidatus Glassbacteria bacterium]|nr:beta-N-acetylhexosaminidase [Candidatus Glassbacteria bacterium]
MMRSCLAVMLVAFMSFFPLRPAFAQSSLNIIPAPLLLELGEGSVTLSIGSAVVVEPGTRACGEYLADLLSKASGAVIPLMDSAPEQPVRPTISLALEPGLKHLGNEGYLLVINREGVSITSTAAEGVFHGVQTLRQLLPPLIENGEIALAAWELPCLRIEDRPRFGWRGLMMDCSRTFQPPAYLKKIIDLLALYKLNVLHLHLTDDQGWRLEIEKYPELTGIAARFPTKYSKEGGFYSREEMKELIDYAGKRGVAVIPEIEMPGHCLAALAAYPELSCSGGPFEIYPFFKGPGIQRNVYCAGKERTFEFLENVLAEVIELFPSPYVHIGGDEVPKNNWRECADCRARIRAEGLKDEHELQSYFIRRIEKYLNARGRKLLGWDEILEGGLAPRAAVMSWRGTEGGIEAARMGHDVVMSPTSHCYLDYDHQRTSVAEAYSFEPVPEELEAEYHKHILGLQGNMWTHIAVNEPATDIQIFPRLIALAEAGWSAKARRNTEGFLRRLEGHFRRLDRLDVEYFGRR